MDVNSIISAAESCANPFVLSQGSLDTFRRSVSRCIQIVTDYSCRLELTREVVVVTLTIRDDDVEFTIQIANPKRP